MTSDGRRECEGCEWLFQPRRPGAPSRAEEIDAFMEGVRARRRAARGVLWLARPSRRLQHDMGQLAEPGREMRRWLCVAVDAASVVALLWAVLAAWP